MKTVWFCFECQKELTQEELDWWNENVPVCCSGHTCGCRGLPEVPPYCFKCMGTEEGNE